jgi:hypothetical protein
MHSALTEHVLLLSMLARHVFFWLQGIFKSNLRDAAAGGESWQLRQVQAGTAASKHAAFAHFFKPSTQMVSSGWTGVGQLLGTCGAQVMD